MKVNSCQSETIGPDLATTNKSKTSVDHLGMSLKLSPVDMNIELLVSGACSPRSQNFKSDFIYCCNCNSNATIERLLYLCEIKNLFTKTNRKS